MPFFGSGLLGGFIKRRPAKRRAPEDKNKPEKDKKQTVPVAWVAYTDRDGRSCWQSQATGEWTYINPTSPNFVPRIELQPRQQQQVFQQVLTTPPMAAVTPAPYPLAYHPYGQQWVATPNAYQPMPAPWNGGMVPISPVPLFVPATPEKDESDKPAAPAGYHLVIGGGMLSVPPVPIYVPAIPKEEEKKEEDKPGVWERKYDGDGGKYWEHSGTKKRLSQDPFI